MLSRSLKRVTIFSRRNGFNGVFGTPIWTSLFAGISYSLVSCLAFSSTKALDELLLMTILTMPFASHKFNTSCDRIEVYGQGLFDQSNSAFSSVKAARTLSPSKVYRDDNFMVIASLVVIHPPVCLPNSFGPGSKRKELPFINSNTTFSYVLPFPSAFQ